MGKVNFSAQDFCDDLSLARAVELAQIDPLPGSEKQFPAGERNGQARSHQRRLEMRVRVMLEMPESLVELRDRVFQEHQDIVSDIGVGVLVDRQTARRVLREKNDDTFARFRDKPCDRWSDLEKFLARSGPDGDRFHTAIVQRSRRRQKCGRPENVRFRSGPKSRNEWRTLRSSGCQRHRENVLVIHLVNGYYSRDE